MRVVVWAMGRMEEGSAVCVMHEGQPLWQRLNGVALLLLILPKYVFEMEPWRLVFEGAGAVCLIVAIWMMFKDRRRV